MPVVGLAGPPPTVREVEELIREVEDYLRSLPPGAPVVVPLAVSGGGLVLAGLVGAAVAGWWLGTRGEQERAARQAELAAGLLRRPTVEAATLRASLREHLRNLHRQRERVRERGEPPSATEAMPIPERVNALEPRALAHAVALIALWQRAHHRQVHGGLVDAQGRHDAHAAAAASATATFAAQTVRSIGAIVHHAIPEAVRELRRTIQELRQATRAADAELERELARTAERLTQRIGDLVRWLRTEALPELERELGIEVHARGQADRALAHGLAEEAEARTDADAAILAELAPLAAWFGGIGLHTTEKIARNERLIDELEHLDWSSLLAFSSVPALVALVTRLMPPVLEQGPRMLAALEGAAAAALGSI